MFLFHKRKKIGHKEASAVGFVLALMSTLLTGIALYFGEILSSWVAVNLGYNYETFYLVMILMVYLALQGLLFFGFPLYYAQDKKSHMTGFQILLYAVMWILILLLLMAIVMTGLA